MRAFSIIFVFCVTIASVVPLYAEYVESFFPEKRNFVEETLVCGADIFRELRDLLRDNVDAEIIKCQVEELFGKDSELSKTLIEALREDGRISVLNYFNRMTGDEVIHSSERSTENADYNFLEIFRKLKQSIKEELNTDKLKEQIEKLFGKGSKMADQLINMLKDNSGKGKDKILDWIHRVLGEKQRKQRSVKQIFEKVKDFFKDFNIELKERFVKFGEYVKDRYGEALDKSKGKAENIKKIAQEFLRDGRKMSKEIVEEALEFFRQYKEDLGRVYKDLTVKVRDITKKKN